MQKKVGIIQSRGLGDIVIALPIAWEWHEQGYEVYWPICEEFIESFEDSAPWVNWLAVETDPYGKFFLETPLLALESVGITRDEDILYLYQYLSNVPERTDPDLFAMMKFDQYKYAAVGVPFAKKWELAKCITRDQQREQDLYDRVVKQDRYMVYQQQASDVQYEISLDHIDPAVQKIEITQLTNNIFDWLKVIEGAETLVLVDSVFANIVDQLGWTEDRDCYYMRKWNRRVDGNPVFLGLWNYIHVDVPAGHEVRSLADGPQQQPQQQQPKRPEPSQAQTYTPFGQGKGNMPTSFLHATKQGQQSQTNISEATKPNAAKQLLAGLGLKQ